MSYLTVFIILLIIGIILWMIFAFFLEHLNNDFWEPTLFVGSILFMLFFYTGIFFCLQHFTISKPYCLTLQEKAPLIFDWNQNKHTIKLTNGDILSTDIIFDAPENNQQDSIHIWKPKFQKTLGFIKPRKKKYILQASFSNQHPNACSQKVNLK